MAFAGQVILELEDDGELVATGVGEEADVVGELAVGVATEVLELLVEDEEELEGNELKVTDSEKVCVGSTFP